MDTIFRYETLDGNAVQFVPRRFKPFDGEALTRARGGPDGSYDLEVLAEEVRVNGEEHEDSAVIRGRCTFTAEPSPYALVPGGWLPATFVHPRQFIIDRNVVAGIRATRSSEFAARHQGLAWWIDALAGQSALLNPFPCAWEGTHRRPPTLPEFCEAFDEAGAEILRALPRANVIRYDRQAFENAFALMASTLERTGRESAFLTSAVPLIVDIAPRLEEDRLRDDILVLARRKDVELSSLPVLAVLSCLYCRSGSGERSIGRRILKPTKHYDAADAYNALCDFRQMELLARSHSEPGHAQFALLTCDWALAAMWCALGLRDLHESDGAAEVTFDLSAKLFPRLSFDEIEGLQARLQAG